MRKHLLSIFIGCCCCVILWLNSLPVSAEPTEEFEIKLRPANCWKCTSSPYTGCSLHDPSEKPYIYKDPNWVTGEVVTNETGIVCSKHGRLCSWETWIIGAKEKSIPKVYCGHCCAEVIQMYLDKHITELPMARKEGAK